MLRKTLLFASLISPLVLVCPPAALADVGAGGKESRDASMQEQTPRVNINTASAEEIAAALRGVGLARARAIIELREKLGQFTDIDQLLEVRGLGIRILNENRERIRL